MVEAFFVSAFFSTEDQINDGSEEIKKDDNYTPGPLGEVPDTVTPDQVNQRNDQQA
jgi:hypothetical protein